MTTAEAIEHVEHSSESVLLGHDPNKYEIRYKRLLRLIHPDHVPKALQDRANEATVKLNKLYSRLNGRASLPSAVAIGSWIVERPIAKGDICDVHYASSTKNSGKYALKIAHHGSSNDLMDAEAAAIKALHVDKRGEHYKHYIPKIHASFEASGRRVNVIEFADGYYPLSELTAIFNKIEFRHSVWMMNRALSALGFVHNNDIIHGAVLPEHLLYCPKTHHMVLVDWCYSVKHGEPLRAIVKQHKAVYPKETTHPSPATDIYMLAMIIQQSAREIPSRFRGLLDWATADSHKSRPSDAWTLQDKWTSLAEEEYGPAKFVELVIPNQ